MDTRHERAAKNEAMYRAVNREIEHVSEELGDGPRDELTVLCECGRDRCTRTIRLTVAEFEQAHKQRDRFVVVQGHEDGELEHVVSHHDEYLIVDKFGEAERLAEAEEEREGVE